MKQYIASICLVIFVAFGFAFNSKSQILLENPGNKAGHLASELVFFSVNSSDISNLALNKESNQSLIQRLLSFGNKYPFGLVSTGKSEELTNNNKITECLYIAHCQVIRFEGPDIIHPFNYFW